MSPMCPAMPNQSHSCRTVLGARNLPWAATLGRAGRVIDRSGASPSMARPGRRLGRLLQPPATALGAGVQTPAKLDEAVMSARRRALEPQHGLARDQHAFARAREHGRLATTSSWGVLHKFPVSSPWTPTSRGLRPRNAALRLSQLKGWLRAAPPLGKGAPFPRPQPLPRLYSLQPLNPGVRGTAQPTPGESLANP
jgi:hypothetical protein